MKKLLYCFLIFILLSCEESKEKTKAYVYDTTLHPLPRGFFRLEAKYEFVYNGEVIKGQYKTYRRPIPHVGDSLRVEFPRNRPKHSKVISVIHEID